MWKLLIFLSGLHFFPELDTSFSPVIQIWRKPLPSLLFFFQKLFFFCHSFTVFFHKRMFYSTYPNNQIVWGKNIAKKTMKKITQKSIEERRHQKLLHREAPRNPQALGLEPRHLTNTFRSVNPYLPLEHSNSKFEISGCFRGKSNRTRS